MRLGAAALLLLPFALLPVLTGCIRGSGSDGPLLPTPPTSSPLPPPPALNAPEPTPTSLAPPAPPSVRPTAASPTGFSESYVVPCGGHPSAAQVIAVVRRHGSLLAAGASVSATTGPLCSGTWQYTVLAVPDHEPLQVVTKGAPSALRFVTAGTNVCTVDVRAEAPVALLSTANC